MDKPLGWTSHDVVARVRRLVGQREVGHAGTLDPLASGLLVLVLGDATRLSSYLMDSPKTYRAEVILGATTATDDAEGSVDVLRGAQDLTLGQVEMLLPSFVGELQQVPPAYSAVRRGGEKLYVLARKGIEVTPEPRTVVVHAIEVEAWKPADDGVPTAGLRLRVRCGAGTYIRSLARDIGAALGTGGYLHALRRVESGAFHLDQTVQLESLQGREEVRSALVPPDAAVLDLPALVLSDSELRQIRFGQAVAMAGASVGTVRLYDSHGTLVALAEGSETGVRPVRVFAHAGT